MSGAPLPPPPSSPSPPPKLKKKPVPPPAGATAGGGGGGGSTDKKTDAPLRAKQIPQHQVAITIEDSAPPVLVGVKKKPTISVGALASAIASIEPALWIACTFLVTIANNSGGGGAREARWLRILSATVSLAAEAYFLFAMVLWKNYAAAAGSQRWLALVAAVALAFVANFLFLFPFIFQ